MKLKKFVVPSQGLTCSLALAETAPSLGAEQQPAPPPPPLPCHSNHTLFGTLDFVLALKIEERRGHGEIERAGGSFCFQPSCLGPNGLGRAFGLISQTFEVVGLLVGGGVSAPCCGHYQRVAVQAEMTTGASLPARALV